MARSVAQISAEGVLSEFDYAVDYEDGNTDRIRIIYAENGRGKTNFIRAISLLLAPSLESLQLLVEIPVARLRVTFSDGSQLALRRQTAFGGGFTVSANESAEGLPVELVIEPSDFAGRLYRRVWDEREDFNAYIGLATSITTGAALISDERLAPSYDDSRDGRSEGVGVGRLRRPAGPVTRLLDRVERMLSQSAFAGLARDRASEGVYSQITRTTLAGNSNTTAAVARQALEEQLDRLREEGEPYERYGFLSLRQLDEISGQVNTVRQNNRQLPILYRIIKPYLDSVEAQIDSLSSALELTDTFVSGVNKFLERKKLVFSASRGIALIGRDGVTLNADQLSSGERHLIYLMSQALLATQDQPLVVIDEPELSLGIEWQRMLVGELLRCTEQAGVRFLVASHSLQVMNAVARNTIIEPSESR